MYICIFVYLCICVDIDKEDKDIDTDTYIYMYRCVCMYKCVYEKRTYLYARTCSNMDILSYSWLFRIVLLFIFITIHLPKMDLDREAHASKAFFFRNGHFILCGRLQEYHLFRRPVSDLGGLWGSRSTESGRFERNLTIQCILKGGRVALPRKPRSPFKHSSLCTLHCHCHPMDHAQSFPHRKT